VPQLDKDYLVSFARLPTGATLDRSEMSCGRWSTSLEAEPWTQVPAPFFNLDHLPQTSSERSSVGASRKRAETDQIVFIQ